MKTPNYIYYSLVSLWLYSGIVPILFNQQDSLKMLEYMYIPAGIDWVLFIASSMLDVVYGLLILSRWRNSWIIWLAQFITVAIYSILIAIFLPDNFIHPFAPLIKNIPILAILWWLYKHHKVKLS